MAFHTDNYEIRWRNFCVYEDTGWIALKPLTILIGANNCGKSSLLAPLLVMNQTLESSDATSPLISRGGLINVGTYKDLIRDHDVSRDLVIGLRFHLHSLPKDGDLGEMGDQPPGGVEVRFKVNHDSKYAKLVCYSLEDVYRRPMLTQTVNDDGSYTLDGLARIDEMSVHESAALQKAKPINFSFSPSAVLAAGEDEAEWSTGGGFSKSFSLYLSALGFAHGELMRFFRTMSYIGPLRERPKRVYEFDGAVPRSVGARGQSMAHYLSHHFDELKPKIDKWIQAFEFGDGLTVKMLDDATLCALYFERDGNKEHTNVADSGFGASQLLPLIVQAVSAPTQNMVIAEQPEAHLNPKLQAKLGDLLVEMVRNDHRLLVETHSEHILLSIRTKIALKEISAADVKVLFVEAGGALREIRINEDGSLPTGEWPKNFLAEGLQQAFALSAAQAAYSNGKSVGS